MTAWLSFLAALTGLGLISLTMQRHVRALPDWCSGQARKNLLRLFGSLSLIASGVAALGNNPQLGAIYWSGYLLAAVLLVTSIYAYAERRAARLMLLFAAMTLGSGLLGMLPAAYP